MKILSVLTILEKDDIIKSIKELLYMKKAFALILSTVFIFLTLFQTAFAGDKEVENDYSAEEIGSLPKRFQMLVNGNLANSSGHLSEDGYCKFNSEDGKVEVVKYNIYGKKLFTAEYDYKYAGKDKIGTFNLLNFRKHDASVKLINDNGDTFVCSRLLRTIPLLRIDLASKHNLVKIDSDGNVLWKLDFKRNEVYFIRSMVELDDGSLILGVTNKTKWINSGIDDFKVTLMKLSADGELIKKVDLQDGFTMVDNLVNVDGRGFMGMVTETELVGENDFENRKYLCAFDEDLNTLWEYEIDSIFYQWDKDNASENGYPVKVKKNKDTPLYETKEQSVIRLDFDKNVVSKNTFKTKNENEYINNIYFLNNGECIVEYNTNSEFSQQRQARWVRFSKGFRNLGELELTGYGILDIIETENECIFCCWNALSYNDYGSVQDRENVYIAFDKDWNLLWQKGVAEK